MYFINGKFNQTFRTYDLYKKLGIVSVTGRRNKSAVEALKTGDVFALYSSGSGYLGVGRVARAAVPFKEVEMHRGGLLIEHPGYPFREIYRINPHFGREEYVVRVEWLAIVPELEDGMIDDNLFIGENPVELMDDVHTEVWLEQTFNVSIRT